MKALGITLVIAIFLFLLAIWFRFPAIDPPMPEAPITTMVDLTNVSFTPAPVDKKYVSEHSGGSEAAHGQENTKAETKTVAEGSQTPTENNAANTPPDPSSNSGDLEKDPDVKPTHTRTTPSDNASANVNSDPNSNKTGKIDAPPAKHIDPRLKDLFGPKGSGGKDKTGTSNGTGGSTFGPRGKPDGKGGTTSGTGGTTSGTGPGDGPGYELGGRTKLSIPGVDDNSNKSGIIVVKIIVDRDGKVISAEPGIRGTTLFDEDLNNKARLAALKARFAPKPDAMERQTGKIIYNFKVR